MGEPPQVAMARSPEQGRPVVGRDPAADLEGEVLLLLNRDDHVLGAVLIPERIDVHPRKNAEIVESVPQLRKLPRRHRISRVDRDGSLDGPP